MSELYHYGIKGQKWGVRRYQNEDGTLTEEGRRRYGLGDLESSRNEYVKGKSKRRSYEIESQRRYAAVRKASREMYDEAHQDSLDNEQKGLTKALKKANANKEFVKDWKKQVKKYVDNPDELTESESIKELKQKYPQFEDLIDGFAPSVNIGGKEDFKLYNKIDSDTKKSFRMYNEKTGKYETKFYPTDPISEMFYDGFVYGETKKWNDISKLDKQAYKELDNYFMNKYGSDVINNTSEAQRQEIAKGAAIIAGLALGGMVVAGLIKDHNK